MKTYAIHPYADLFPTMLPDDWAAFVADIRQHGVRQPVTIYQGKLLDGRHRYRAVQELRGEGVEVQLPTVEFTGTDDEALQYAISANLRRRHMSTGQRAILAVDLKLSLQQTIKPGRPNSVNIDGIRRGLDAREIAAEMVNVSTGSITKAEKLLSVAPDLAAQVRKGQLSLSAAEKVMLSRLEAHAGEDEAQDIGAESCENNPASRCLLVTYYLPDGRRAITELPYNLLPDYMRTALREEAEA